MTTVSREEAEAFLYLEARLMDESRYQEWEALWADDGVYWVPCGDGDYDPTLQTSIIYDDRSRIGHRVARLISGAAHCQDPPSRLRRVISNVEVSAAEHEAVVESNFILVEARNGLVTWAGRSVHRLQRREDGVRMAFKKVTLVNADAELPVLGFLI